MHYLSLKTYWYQWTLEEWETMLDLRLPKSHRPVVKIGIEDDRVIGYWIGKQENDDPLSFYLWRLGVLPHCRGRGLSYHLINSVCSHASANRANRIHHWTPLFGPEEPEFVGDWWGKVGFRATGETEHPENVYWYGQQSEQYKMVLDLGEYNANKR